MATVPIHLPSLTMSGGQYDASAANTDSITPKKHRDRSCVSSATVSVSGNNNKGGLIVRPGREKEELMRAQAERLERELLTARKKLGEAQSQNETLRKRISSSRIELLSLRSSFGSLSGQMSKARSSTVTKRNLDSENRVEIEEMIGTMQQMKKQLYEEGSLANKALHLTHKWRSMKALSSTDKEINYLQEYQSEVSSRVSVLSVLERKWKGKVTELWEEVRKRSASNQRLSTVFQQLSTMFATKDARETAAKAVKLLESDQEFAAYNVQLIDNIDNLQTEVQTIKKVVDDTRKGQETEQAAMAKERISLQERLSHLQKKTGSTEISIRRFILLYKNEVGPALHPLFSLFQTLHIAPRVSIESKYRIGETLTIQQMETIRRELEDKMEQTIALLSSVGVRKDLKLALVSPKNSTRRTLRITPPVIEEVTEAPEDTPRRRKTRRAKPKEKKIPMRIHSEAYYVAVNTPFFAF